MAKKPRENRVPIMMSDDELQAIDDWRFENRVATRSDAVRRLCQIGILFDERATEITNKAVDLCINYESRNNDAIFKFTNKKSEFYGNYKEYIQDSIEITVDTVDEIRTILNILNELMAPLTSLKDTKNVEEGLTALESAKLQAKDLSLSDEIQRAELRKNLSFYRGNPKEDDEK